jgi:tRNA G10  N-methylase Trm11/alkylated DNA repair dioxygenase AlkB
MEDYLLPGLQTPCVYHDPNFLPEKEAHDAYQTLLAETPWEKTAKINRWVTLMELHDDYDSIVVAKEENNELDDGGKERCDKKITAAVSQTTTAATTAKSGYKYRDAPGDSIKGFPPIVHRLKILAEEWYNSRRNINVQDDKTTTTPSKVEFNVCLLNYYEDGQQRIGWHSDREEIGRSTPIASISLGATRQFQIRSKTNGAHDRVTVYMTHGSIMIMENICQLQYLHSVPREVDITDGRINLTFRCKQQSISHDGGKLSATTMGEEEHERRDKWIDQITTVNGVFDTTAGSWKREGGGGDGFNDRGTTTKVVVDDDNDVGGRLGQQGEVFGDSVNFHDPSSSLSSGQLLPSEVVYVVKTNIGAECYCAAEIKEILFTFVYDNRYFVLARPFGIAGYIAICYRTANNTMIDEDHEDDDEDEGELALPLEREFLRLRTAHHVLKYHDHFELSDVVVVDTSLDDLPDTTTELKEEKEEGQTAIQTNVIGSITGEMIYEFYKKRLVSNKARISSLVTLEEGGTFRTTCERIGCGHGFQAPEIEREVGGAMSEYYTHIKPKMTNYDINVRVDVIATKVVVGTQINIDDLSKERHFLCFRNVVTIKTNLAYAMIRCANVKVGNLIVDPFCGSGTILLEALDVFQGQVRCIGMDVSRRSANGAQENARAEGYDETICKFHCCDARAFRKHLEEESVDAIVSNLPWGVVTGMKNVSDLQSMYEVFLRSAWYILKDKARIVMLVLRGLQLTRIIRKLSGRWIK